jgi:anti-anti-sigma factor
MIVTTTIRPGAPVSTVLHVAGEVDTFAAVGLREHLQRAAAEPDRTVVVDLSAVTFMSCRALAVLAQARARLGPRLVLSAPSRAVTRLLTLTGLTAYFAVPGQEFAAPAGEGAGPAPRGPNGTATHGAPPTCASDVRTWTFSRADVDRARRLLTAVHGCDAEQAWRMLALASARQGVPVGELVDLLVRPRRNAAGPPSASSAIALLTVLMRKSFDAVGADLERSDLVAGRECTPSA